MMKGDAKMSFFQKLFGQDPETKAGKKFIDELRFRSSDIAAIEAAIDRFERQNPVIGALGNAAGIIGGGGRLQSALQPLRDLQSRLSKAQQKEQNIRANAAVRLGELRQNSAIKPLITATNDKYPLVRLAAIRALGSIGDNRAIEPLTTLIENSKEKQAARDAIEAIKKTMA
jgi:hypothetical protein